MSLAGADKGGLSSYATTVMVMALFRQYAWREEAREKEKERGRERETERERERKREERQREDWDRPCSCFGR